MILFWVCCVPPMSVLRMGGVRCRLEKLKFAREEDEEGKWSDVGCSSQASLSVSISVRSSRARHAQGQHRVYHR